MRTRFIPSAPVPATPLTVDNVRDFAGELDISSAPEQQEPLRVDAVALEPVEPTATELMLLEVIAERKDTAQEIPAVTGEAPPVERATPSENLSFQDYPGNQAKTAGPVYADAIEWMSRNGLPYDKTVILRGYPHMNASWPCTLGTAMLYGGYLAGQSKAFEILLAETEEPLLVGGDEAGRLYGVTQVAAELTRLYEVQRNLFLLYQAKFPVQMALGENTVEGSIAEVFIVQLSDMLEQAHERTKRADGALNVMDLIGVAVALSLRKAFGGLVPLDRLGSLLQDTERMDWLQANADDLLGLKSAYRP